MQDSKLSNSCVFRTEKGAIIQDDHRRQYILEFQGKRTVFKVSDFLQFKKQLDQIDLAQLFLEDGKGMDVQILHQKGSDQIFVFTLCELVAIKELFHGAKTMLELNRILQERLHPVKL